MPRHEYISHAKCILVKNNQIKACMLSERISNLKKGSILQDRVEKAAALWSDNIPSNAAAESVYRVDHY